MGYCDIPKVFFSRRQRRETAVLRISATSALQLSLREGKSKIWERMKDDERDAPCLTAVCRARSAHITLLLFSHMGLREASHGHRGAQTLTTSHFIKNKQNS